MDDLRSKKSPSFGVIVPVVNKKNADQLFSSIEHQESVFPERVFIIDNSEADTPYSFESSRFDVVVMRRGYSFGVNPSWNLGVEQIGDFDYLSILNDDVILGNWFFFKVADIFSAHEDCGVVCPETSKNLQAFRRIQHAPQGSVRGKMLRREGWAFTMRSGLAREVFPIPKELKIYCGDDWLWLLSHEKGYFWFRNAGNVVYHAVGDSIRSLGIGKDILRAEKRMFNTLATKWREK